MHVWLLLTYALWLLPTLAAADASPVPAARELAARVASLTDVASLDDAVQRPLAIARRALADARAAEARGAREEARRDEAVALAAVELAEARLRLVRERALLKAAEARHRDAVRELAHEADAYKPAPPPGAAS